MRIPQKAGRDVMPESAHATEESWDSFRVVYNPAVIPIDYRVNWLILARMVKQGVRVYVTLTSYPQGTYRGEMYGGSVRWIECHVSPPARRPHDAA